MDDVEVVYHRAESDAAAARELNWTKNEFRAWRLARGLPAMVALEREARDNRIRAVWLQGVSSASIARQLALDQGTVAKALHRSGLPPAPVAARRASNVPSFNHRRWKAYCRSRSRVEAAAMIGDTSFSFRRWVKRQGLPSRLRSRAYRGLMVEKALKGDPYAQARCRELGLAWRLAE